MLSATRGAGETPSDPSAKLGVKRRPRKRWVAAALSLPLPGLGHLYAGRVVTAVAYFLLVVIAPFAIGMIWRWFPFGSLTPHIAIGGQWAVLIWIVVDAARVAGRADEHFAMRPYNQWYVYVGLMAVVGLVAAWTRDVSRAQIIEAFRIPSGAMQPTLLIGDFLIVSKRAADLQDIGRGAMVLYESREEPGIRDVKRIVGLPGDSLEMRDNFVFLDGEPLEEPYVVRSDEATDPRDAMMRSWQAKYLTGDLDIRSYRPTLKNWGPLVVPSDSFFVMGDNRDRSYDSRYWGFLGVDRIQGRPLVIYYSYDRNGVTPLPFITAVRWGRIGQRFEWGKALEILCCRDD